MVDLDQAHLLKPMQQPMPASNDVEIRFVLFRVDGVDIAGASVVDLQVEATLDWEDERTSSASIQCSDTHANYREGTAWFNWRFVFPCVGASISGGAWLSLRVLDRRLGGSVLLGQVNLDLSKPMQCAHQLDQLYHAEDKLPVLTSAGAARGLLHGAVQILKQQEADCAKVGLGRESPNRDPFLPVPAGGREWSDFVASVGFGVTLESAKSKLRLIVGTLASVLGLLLVLYIVLLAT
eukprot:GHVT01090014.1.p1 GENE.GHVT01090014.1~~GHVT01090014.1.p1  ORF type:complete len:268 (-),score=50.82 GHVT01090014.1:446-1156(-)